MRANQGEHHGPRWRRSALAAGTAIGLAVLGLAAAQPAAADTPAPSTSYNGLALTPPMGFNDWNAFGCNVSAQLIESTALAMHNNGMQAAGYDYVNIDDCWILGRNASEIPAGQTKASVGRNADGHLVVDPNYFPPSAPGLNDGIEVVADYVHSLGMKLGIYEDTGTATCQGLAGTYKNGSGGQTWDTIDAQDYADWGVDLLKDDWCNVPLADVPGATRNDKANYLYTQMSQALQATGRPIVFEAATLGDTGLQTYTWAPTISNYWRTTSDISANYASMLRNFTTNSALAQYAAPGRWNDPDMLEIGTGSNTTLAADASPGDTNIKVSSTSGAAVGAAIRIGTTAAGDLESGIISAVGTAGASGTGITLSAPLTLVHPSGEAVGKTGMTITEEQTHLSLWSIEAAPLIAGTNVVDIAPQNLAVYENRDVIAVDQDPLGVQAAVISNANGQWILEKPLANGDTAVVLFNANATPWTDASASLSSLGLSDSATYAARDLWSNSVSSVSGSIDVASIPAHGTVMLRLSSACSTAASNGAVTVGSGQSVCVADGGGLNGPIKVTTGGELWVTHGSITGPVTVATGGQLNLSGATVSGKVSSTGASDLTICGTNSTGPINVTGSTGPVLIGGGDCAANTVSGPVTVTGNTDGVGFSGNAVTGPLSITDNSGGFQYGDNSVVGPVRVSNNS